MRSLDRVAERGGEAAGECRCPFHRDLLAEYRADRQLEAVEGTRYSKTRVQLDRRAEELVAREPLRYHIGTGTQIEEVAQSPEERG